MAEQRSLTGFPTDSKGGNQASLSVFWVERLYDNDSALYEI